MSLCTPEGYQPLDETKVPAFLAAIPKAAARLGGGAEDWAVKEVGDGNLNLVFTVTGPRGGLCVKQSLPYVRMVGEGWPLPLERAVFEHRCLVAHGRHVGALMPEVLHFDARLFAIVMELLTPHIIMRRGMVDAVRYPHFAEHITDYMARAHYHTSDLARPAADKKQDMAVFAGNTALCKITEDLIFTDPYRQHERNRWTTPDLDDLAAAFRADWPLKAAISRLKLKFLALPQALIHGDLHTGSVMVTETETKVIDPEFAFYGPMGFDIGAVLGNLLINYFSQDGHAEAADDRSDYQAWVLDTVRAVWRGFATKFTALWRDHNGGDAYHGDLFAGPEGAEALARAQTAFLDDLFKDSLGFAGAKMIRRILGLAHNIDLELIEPPSRRALCEARCLRLARELVVNRARYPDIASVTGAARRFRAEVNHV